MNKKNDIKGLSFEQALSELEDIVEKLEQGDIDLEDSIDIYERGNLLKAHCEKKLESAKMKIDKIISQPDGDFSSESYEE
ncbi:MAG: exodeoxyribonuclease VII small subunit [Pseudomonadota bacterium]|nr:exodeoxyribonuclease VII small subunit [Pseudomonadota bacterium]MEC7830567.1 exodeoxyribonuclease VII small subunit [Pseudomonadota bacterium]MEC9382535.1 exodeoxyribonuclease VII small subunit [Pseudomonadota bacterium]MEC9392903.1 exodeoxyribonuclease VII small subunit [Pseudomonadota bacterium]MEC9481291.1 exodeoxyribonuclease VII small subunit [Pseudomonadota bacterium]